MGQATEYLITLCQRKGIRYVHPRGPRNSALWLVGEAGGEEEEKKQLAFVGPAGWQVGGQLREADLDEDSICFTNPYKVRPPDNQLGRLAELGIPLDLYEAQFWEELDEYKPTIIIAAGATALGLLCPHTIQRRTGTAPIGRWRASLLQSPRLGWPHYIIPMQHPAFILRNYEERDMAIFALRRAKEEFEFFLQSGTLQPLPERQLLVEPTFDDAFAFMMDCLNSPNPLLSVDIEMLRRRFPYTIALSPDPKLAMSMSFWEYSAEQCVRLWRVLDQLMRAKSIIGQNFSNFDACWLQHIGFRPNIEKHHDAMVRHHVLWPELSHKLQFMVMQYTREPYFKDEGKNWDLRRESKQKLMRYNCKDAATAIEIYLGQEEEFDERPELRRFYESYELPLSRKLHYVSKRGILTDVDKMKALRKYILIELAKACTEASKIVGVPVAPDKINSEKMGHGAINLNSPPQVRAMLKTQGLVLPVSRDTGRESTAADKLNKMYAECGDPILKHILRVRELNKIKGTYIDAKLLDNVMLTEYVVTGTVTGRRSSRSNFMRYGGNLQNQPKHSDLAKKYRECLIARPGKVFLECDQAQAEDWIVQGIITDSSGHRKGLDELLNHIDRHRRLASFIFGKPQSECGKGTSERFLGKKTRHAGNYDMRGPTMSQALAKEDFHLAPDICDAILEKFHSTEPEIRNVFHAHIETELLTKRRLVTPLGRSRDFFGMRPRHDNHKIFREAYAYIPQSTIGDNNGMALLYCEDNAPGLVIMDTHDALTLEVDDNVNAIMDGHRLLTEAFDRTLRFPRGLEINIPVEFEIGYNLKGMVECNNFTATGLESILGSLRQQREALIVTTGGVQLQSSPLH